MRCEERGSIARARQGLNAEVRALSRVNNTRFLLALSRQWLVIGAAISLAIWLGGWVAYVFAMIIIATRQHALGILMHDATHYRCLSNRAANDVICDFFCSLPLGMLTSRYRYEHILHHRFANTVKDPYWSDFENDADWQWPKKWTGAFAVILRDLSGLGMIRISKATWRWSPWSNHFSRKTSPPPMTWVERSTTYVFFLAITCGLTLSGAWFVFLLFWIVPLSTLTVFLIRCRTIAEHLAVKDESELDATRHVDAHILERLSLSPLNINYHIAHHLFPSVPYYNLPKLHKKLMAKKTYRERAHFNKSYLGWGPDAVLSELIVRRSRRVHHL